MTTYRVNLYTLQMLEKDARHMPAEDLALDATADDCTTILETSNLQEAEECVRDQESRVYNYKPFSGSMLTYAWIYMLEEVLEDECGEQYDVLEMAPITDARPSEDDDPEEDQEDDQ